MATRISRRDLLIGAAASGALACTGDKHDAKSAHAAELERGKDTLVVAFDGAGVTTFALDPHNSG